MRLRVVHDDGNGYIGHVVTHLSIRNEGIDTKLPQTQTMFPPAFELIECHDLFNILNAELNGLARISDTNYLYLLGSISFKGRARCASSNRLILDCRSRKEYDESHVISANHMQRVSLLRDGTIERIC